MCGIVGLWKAEPDRDDLERRLGRAVARINHRGPDDHGIWTNDVGDVGLGHVRLSIIDPTDSAKQPMFDRSDRYGLIFNGEIYNYRDLFHQFCPRDGSVNGDSDTAVLLYLLATKGIDCLQYLDGMFAFAFFDVEERKFLLARDRFGEKPLYWLQDKGLFAFSSELVGLRSLLPERDFSINQSATNYFHANGSIPAPHTIFDGVHSLESASWLSWQPGKQPKLGKYWNLRDFRSRDNLSREDTTSALEGAVTSRMVSDVPVGVFLSGGIDSSAILATACHSGARPDLVLCVDFAEAEYSEFFVANALAKKYSVPMHRHELTKEMFSDGVDGFFAAMDQPTIDGFNTYFLSIAAAATGIKVWLSGVGGDELFGGYPSFTRMRGLRTASAVAQLLVPDRLATSYSAASRKYKLARAMNLAVKGDPSMRAYQVCRQLLPTAKLPDFLIGAKDRSIKDIQLALDSLYDFAADNSSLDDFQKASLFESHMYMRSQLLRDIDNFSMAKSLEVRAPFLDHRLFSSVWSLPAKQKNYNDTLKPLLIDSVPGGLPDIVPVNQKRGFTFPVERWAREGMANDFRDVISDRSNQDIWPAEYLDKLWSAYHSGGVHWSVLWTLFSFAKWREAHAC